MSINIHRVNATRNATEPEEAQNQTQDPACTRESSINDSQTRSLAKVARNHYGQLRPNQRI